MGKYTSKLPEWVKEPLRQLRAIPYYGSGRWCPVCGKSSRRFRRYGLIKRDDAQCPQCGALERHRLVWLYLTQKTNVFDNTPKTMLHVAPERFLEWRFSARIGHGYLTADLYESAMVRMDITNIQYPDDSFDVIYCSHVLEHVQDDRRAMREFRRVLKPNGLAILLVPITTANTFEDPSIVHPKDRLKAFGQEDHVRRYGQDYVDRLRESGFIVVVTTAGDLADPQEAVRMGLTASSGEVYSCTKLSQSRGEGPGIDIVTASQPGS